MNILKQMFSFSEDKSEGFTIKESTHDENEKEQDGKVFLSVFDNVKKAKEIYSIPKNSDVAIKEFKIKTGKKETDAAILFIEAMASSQMVDDYILRPLMNFSSTITANDDVLDLILKRLITHAQLTRTKDFKKAVELVNKGDVMLFVDEISEIFVFDVKGFEHRTVQAPEKEVSLYGPQQAFNEVIRINTSLIRRMIKDENLICEMISVGSEGKTACALLYMKNITNDSLVEEARKRLKNIKAQYLLSSEEIAMMLEKKSFLSLPKCILTERPDRAARSLIDGRVCIIVEGNPFVIVLPATIFELMSAADDSYTRVPYINFIRTGRLIALLISLLLPAFYLALTTFHQEMLPADFLMSIVKNRESLHFSTLIELLIMELAFEIIREAGIRVPNAIGSTLSLVGALILGQAAVSANIVSPMLIIVVAITAMGSFATPNYSLGIAIRTLKIGYIISAQIAGFLGICIFLVINLVLWTGEKSFGVPTFAPFAPRTGKNAHNALFTKSPEDENKRPIYLKTKMSKK